MRNAGKMDLRTDSAAEQSTKLLAMYTDYCESICETAKTVQEKLEMLAGNLSRLAAEAKESRALLDRIQKGEVHAKRN